MLPGDLVQFTTVRTGKRGFRILVDHIEHPENPPDLAYDLAEPFCSHYKKCGGCRGQHFSYESQLQIKMSPVVESLKQDCGIEPLLLPAPHQRAYRNRMDFVVEGSVIGQRAAGDFESFHDIDTCPIQKDEANDALALVRASLQRYPEAACERKKRPGALRYVTIRRGHESGVIVLTVLEYLKNNEEYLEFRSDLIASLENGVENGSFPAGYSLVETSVDSESSEISAPPGGKVLYGESFFRDVLGGISFDVPYDSFFQPNPPAFSELIDFAVQQLQSRDLLRENSGVLSDIYCGAGVLSSVLVNRTGARFRIVEGVDFTESAIRRAPEHFSDFAGTVDFIAEDLNKPTRGIFRNGIPDLIIADPPRAGLSPAVRRAFLDSGAPVIAYFSCNPQTQLSDLRELKERYDVVAAALSDPYPQTPHLEQVVILKRKDEGTSEQNDP